MKRDLISIVGPYHLFYSIRPQQSFIAGWLDGVRMNIFYPHISLAFSIDGFIGRKKLLGSIVQLNLRAPDCHGPAGLLLLFQIGQANDNFLILIVFFFLIEMDLATSADIGFLFLGCCWFDCGYRKLDHHHRMTKFKTLVSTGWKCEHVGSPTCRFLFGPLTRAARSACRSRIDRLSPPCASLFFFLLLCYLLSCALTRFNGLVRYAESV